MPVTGICIVYNEPRELHTHWEKRSDMMAMRVGVASVLVK